MSSEVQKSVATAEDMHKISSFARRELSPDEVYIFSVNLCNNDIDRDYERFTVEALEQLAPMFVGKTGISDHSMRSADQRARVFDTYVEKQEGRLTSDGEPLYCLKARAYMLNNDANRALIDEIDAGIKKEVSVSCSMGSAVCSICGTDRRKQSCKHTKGKTYGGKLCHTVLSDAGDAYEFSFVAVPAQREAGVTKSFRFKEGADMNDIIKSIDDCDSDLMFTKSQARELSAYIDDLRRDAELGEEYKKQLAKEVIGLFSNAFPAMDKKLFASVTSVMTANELLGFRNGMKNAHGKKSITPQLLSDRATNAGDYSQFKI